MDFWMDQFFGNSYGLSVTIGFIIMLGIGAWFVFYFISKMKQAEAEQAKKLENSHKN